MITFSLAGSVLSIFENDDNNTPMISYDSTENIKSLTIFFSLFERIKLKDYKCYDLFYRKMSTLWCFSMKTCDSVERWQCRWRATCIPLRTLNVWPQCRSLVNASLYCSQDFEINRSYVLLAVYNLQRKYNSIYLHI